MKNVVHAACPHDCPDACGVLITIEDGRATKIQGDPSHPVTRGFLCAKVAKYLDRVYSPERVLYPMRRVAHKGTGHKDARDFQRTSWNEALGEIAARFKTIAADFGGEAILPYSYGGTLALLGSASMDRRFFHRLGASQLERAICSAAGEAGLKSVLGVKMGTEPEQFRHSKYIIAWGSNIHGNNIHLWPFIEEARRAGAKLVVLDPYRTRTAACADWYLPINPGTDLLLALSMMHVIVAEHLTDDDYIARATLGYADLLPLINHPKHAPEATAATIGISAEDIRTLAREYATAKPAVIRALTRPDLFTVVHDQFLTDSCDYADIVLPACTWFEYKDLQTAYGHYYLQLSSPAIAPLGESRDNVTVFRDLARHMGFTDPCFSDTHDDLIDQALATDDPFVAGITREQLERDHRVRLSIHLNEPRNPQIAPFSDGTFPTPSGRALIHNPALATL